MTVREGRGTLRLIWDKPDYDAMRVHGKKYQPVNPEGNSVFEIPVSALDESLSVIVNTVGMGQPHEISYSLRFGNVTPVS